MQRPISRQRDSPVLCLVDEHVSDGRHDHAANAYWRPTDCNCPACECSPRGPGSCYRQCFGWGEGVATEREGEIIKMSNEPHVTDRRSHLKLARSTVRCGARRKSDGLPCQQAAMKNGRCFCHGGASTGPRTLEGLERSRKARWKHGHYSAVAKSDRQQAHWAVRALRKLASMIGG